MEARRALLDNPTGDASTAVVEAGADAVHDEWRSSLPPPRLRIGHYLILISLNSIGAFSSDCYIPNLSDIVDDLHTSDTQVSLTIQINWYLLGLATPIVGHLSDMLGRKLVVYVALGIYIAGAVGSAFAPTIEWLLVARCVQGVGESVSIITSAIIRDLIDDKQKRMRVQAYFTTMRPLMLLGGPSIGGFVGTAVGWRNLMKGLAGWGVLNLLLFSFIPESNAAHLDAQQPSTSLTRPPPQADATGHPEPPSHDATDAGARPPPPPTATAPAPKPPRPLRRFRTGLDASKFRRMATNVDFLGLTAAAAICMGAVRAMLSNISFVYKHYYGLSTAIGGVLISVPPLVGFISSLFAARAATTTSPARLVRWGMAAGVLPPVLMLVTAGLPGCIHCLYARPRWYMTTLPCALLSAVGFFALPAMQVLVLQDFKDMSGLAGGLSKLAMTLTSTGASELVSFYFSDWGADPASTSDKGHYTHYHTQRLLYALAAILIVLQLWFWLVYVPIKRWERWRLRRMATNASQAAPSVQPLAAPDS